MLHKMYKYEMDPTKTVGATERIRDGRTDGVKAVYKLRCAGGGGGGGGALTNMDKISKIIQSSKYQSTRMLACHVKSNMPFYL